DDRQRARHDARGKQRQLVDLLADDERMAGIVTALEADHGVGAAGEPVDDLALALVAPLRPDDGNICHDAVLLSEALPARRGLSGFGRGGKGGREFATLPCGTGYPATASV